MWNQVYNPFGNSALSTIAAMPAKRYIWNASGSVPVGLYRLQKTIPSKYQLAQRVDHGLNLICRAAFRFIHGGLERLKLARVSTGG